MGVSVVATQKKTFEINQTAKCNLKQPNERRNPPITTASKQIDTNDV
ncbi:17010_t:CDS:1, partial [Cetraspora pellucida]